MIFTPTQIQELLQIVQYNTLLFGVEYLGVDPLTPEDKELLKLYGVDVTKIPKKEYVEMAYKFGVISKAIGNDKAKKLKYNDFKRWFSFGGYIPLSEQEQDTVDYLKRKSFGHLKNLGNKMSSDVNQMLLEQDSKRRLQTEKLIQKELKEGVENRKSFKEVMSNLGNKTQDWERDWDRIVETEMHTAYQEGRADDIQRNNPDRDPLVFKHVQQTACRHCISAYLTNGLGSKPRVFKLSELRLNGTNIGKKQENWVATLGSLHPFSLTDKTTPILTDQGWKKIIDINIGDVVLTHRGRFKKVINTLKDYPCPKDDLHKYSYTIYYKHINNKDPDNLVKLTFTGDHKILTNNGWVMVKNLNINHKLIKLMKKCIICDNYIESYNNNYKSCCSKKCLDKYRTNNTYKQWNNYSDKEINDLKFKISEKVKENWENGLHKNTLKNLQSKDRIEKSRQMMLNGGAIKALNGRSGGITSKQQLKLYEMVLRLFPDAKLEYKIFNRSLDIALVNYKIDIEFDGMFWHNNRNYDDDKRDKLLKSNNWHVLRYKDKLPKIGKLRLDIETIIQNDNHLYGFEETEIVFIKKNYITNNVKLYDLTIEGDESFIARGVVVHNCRCELDEVLKGYVWDQESQSFVPGKSEVRKIERKSRTKITIGDNIYFV